MVPLARSRAKRFADFDEKTVKDIDPEADVVADDGSDSEQSDAGVGTEHYISTGKSNLRQDQVLNKKYSGVRVSRAALDDSSDGEPDDASKEDSQEEDEIFDDPDTADLERDNIIDDEEIDSDDAFQEGEEEIFKKKGFTFKANKATASGKDVAAKPLVNGRTKRAVAADFMSGSEGSGSEDDEEEEASELGDESNDDGALVDGSGSDNSDSEGSSGSDDSEDGSDSGEEREDEEMGGMDTGDTTSDIRKLLKQEQAAERNIISSVSQAVKADTEKGIAVRQQRRTYDSLLNLRIHLQKGLVAVNSLSEANTTEHDDDTSDDDKQPYQAAEEAALKLWAAIATFRTNLLPDAAAAGQKRKRTPDLTTPNEDLWDEMQSTEQRHSAKRKKILEKWSAKVKATTTNAGSIKQRQLGGPSSTESSLTAVLDTQLLSGSVDRLIKRTRVPRSCAPLQAARKVAEDAAVYDDADFYQLLLKELVDQRSSDGGAAAGAAPTVRYTAIKEAKTRKVVDRRASKGRKLRFTVHEKLENFMAPEDRRSWEEEAIDRLFGTLFGQRLGLREAESEDDGEVDVAEEGLKLFRN